MSTHNIALAVEIAIQLIIPAYIGYIICKEITLRRKPQAVFVVIFNMGYDGIILEAVFDDERKAKEYIKEQSPNTGGDYEVEPCVVNCKFKKAW